MATDRTVAIYPSAASAPGGYAATYTSMAAMESAEDGDLTSGGGTRLVVEITESDGSWSGAPDTAFVDFDGWTTDRTVGEYVLIKTVGGARSSTGLWDTTAYIINGSGSSVETIDVDNDFNTGGGAALDIEFEGIQMDHPSNSFATIVAGHVSALSNDIRLTKCYVRQQVNDTAIENTQANSSLSIRIKNCIVENTTTGGSRKGFFTSTNAPTIYIYNCTIFGCEEGVETNSATTHAVNNAVFDNADDFMDSFTTIDFNASDDVDGTNAVDISPAGETEAVRWDEAFTDYTGTQDVTIKDTDSVLYIAGLDQTSDSEIPSDDINGVTRPSGASAVSIGAFEFVVAAGAAVQINIGDVWKDFTTMQINIGDTWKSVTSVKINIGDVWKDVF